MSQAMQPAASAIEVDAFARVRANELFELRAAVLNTRQNRCAHQNLSWHLRRRTLSYSSRRAPARVRVRIERELSSSGARPPRSLGSRRLRKYRARARFLRSHRALRNARPNRLETHEWHAKRFHMTRIPTVGKIVADFCNDRGVRSAFKAFAHSTIAHDASYYDVICVTSTKRERLINSIASVLAPHDAARLATEPVASGMRCARGLVVLEYSKKNAIAPVDVLFRPMNGASETCWIWVHPIASNAVVESFRAAPASNLVTVELLQNELETFRVYGPRAGFVLGAVIERADDFGRTWNIVRYGRSPATSAVCCVISGEMVDPRMNFPPKRVQSMAVAGRDNGTRHTLIEASYSAFSSRPNDSQIWDSSARAVCRPVGSGEPKVDVNMQLQHVPFIMIQRPGEGKRGLGAGWDVILPKTWGRPFWRSLMYANGSRAVGITELAHLALETNEIWFPHDYPDSVCAVRAMRELETEKVEKHNRKPKSKRVNYGMYRIDSPFFSDLSSIGQSGVTGSSREANASTTLKGSTSTTDKDEETGALGRKKKRRINDVDKEDRVGEVSEDGVVVVHRGRGKVVKLEERAQVGTEQRTGFVRVELRVCGRGVALEHALLCKASNKDLEGVDGGRLSSEPQERIEKRSLCGPTDVELTARRESVGRVMRGGFSMARGGPKAIGFLSVTALQQLLLDERCNVSRRRGDGRGGNRDVEGQWRVRLLVRNSESLQYRLCVATVLEA